MDKEKGRCLVLWKTVPEWAEAIGAWVLSDGHQDSVFSLEDLSSGDDVLGTGLTAAYFFATKYIFATISSITKSSGHR